MGRYGTRNAKSCAGTTILQKSHIKYSVTLTLAPQHRADDGDVPMRPLWRLALPYLKAPDYRVLERPGKERQISLNRLGLGITFSLYRSYFPGTSAVRR
jgi:hypothetical protein